MRKILMIVMVFAVAAFSCKKENPQFGGTAKVTFNLTDAPGDYEEVNIDITGLQVIINDTVIDLPVNAGVYNLLDLVNGKDTLLVDDEVPSGKLSQVRLILGENNTVKTSEGTFDLKTPSAQQSGLKLNVHADFLNGVAYEYTIDFDASRSIVTTGSGNFILKPVLKVFTKSVSGAIKGVISPLQAKPVIIAISEQKDSVSTLADATTGKYMFNGLSQGAYKLSFLPVDTFKDTLIQNIQVKTGFVTIVDTMKLK